MVSKKSGQVYERRLIVKYIEDNGKDPVSGEDLSVDDLLDIKSSKSLSLCSSASNAIQEGEKRLSIET